MLYLCSSSATRALLLKKFDIEFEQKSVNFDEEQIQSSNPREFVYLASKGKMQEAINTYGVTTPLLCADTVIASSDGEILRKPKDIDDAKKILLKQSGSSISIISSLHYQKKAYSFSNISATHYQFAKFDTKKLDEYLQSGLWEGKAGGCMVEGFCKEYIKSVDGFESTAMGLQVEVLKAWL